MFLCDIPIEFVNIMLYSHKKSNKILLYIYNEYN